MKDGTGKDGIVEDQGMVPLWMTQPFCVFMEGEKLLPEEQFAHTLFCAGRVHSNRYDELYTYEKRYVNLMTRKAFRKGE